MPQKRAGWKCQKVSNSHLLVDHEPYESMVAAVAQDDLGFLWFGGTGSWNETGTSITNRVNPPWWQTMWFRASAVGLTGATLLLAYRLQNTGSRSRTAGWKPW